MANSPKQNKTKKKGFFATVFRVFIGITITVVLFGILYAVGEKVDERQAREEEELRKVIRPTETTLSAEEEALAERLPDVPKHLRSLQALNHRGMGSCKELTGNVAVAVVFVDDTVSSWTQAEIDKYTRDFYADIADLTHKSAQWGVDLTITMHTCRSTVDYELNSEGVSNNLGPILYNAGYNMYGLNDSLKKERNADAVPFVLVFNKKGRSYASQKSNENQVQACYLFDGSDAFKHELLHLFGAADFYYHDKMDSAVTYYLGESIMADSSIDHIDDLTAYLVGWTDKLTAEAEMMLYMLDFIGNEELQEAQEQNSYTGFGSKEYDDGSVYTGSLIMGVPHGWGIMEYPNGDIYRGDFDNGSRTGEGTYVWTNGDTYEGSFLNGQRHGQGIHKESNGEIYEGTWENNKFIG